MAQSNSNTTIVAVAPSHGSLVTRTSANYIGDAETEGLTSGDINSRWAMMLSEGRSSFGKVPDNSLTRMISRFTANLDTDKNSNFQLPWNFGPFLEDVPRRLGHNAALDAATEAMMAAYMAFRSRGETNASMNNQLCLRSYGRAVNSLRECLNDHRASSSETLCSTMMLLIVETLSGLDKEKVLSHAGGAAGILKARGHAKSRNAFEDKILLSLRGPVIMHALFTTEPLFTDEQWEELIINPIEGYGVDGRVLKTLALFPNLLLDTRAAFSQEPIDYEKLRTIHTKMKDLYINHALNRQEVVARFEELDSREPDIKRLSIPLLVMHSHFARQAAVTLSYEAMLCLLLSTVCSAPLPPPTPHLDTGGFASDSGPEPWSPLIDPYIYLSQANTASKYLSDLCDKVTQHRPLGTIYMTFVMRVAHVAAATDEARAHILEQLRSFAKDMGGPSAQLDEKELNELGDYLSLRDMRGWRPGTGYLDDLSFRGAQDRWDGPESVSGATEIL
ncbi:hypothetical protein BDZ85DRAFT_15916 [Elsinoe ampelina]|uniref:Fungal-specific transcription factor domain-containing protein n=1 Tax=Elsinoe ampelina TaxID=302913 RepID=A0A6A6G6G5_9PEZI|nr:hypothetical protein BDZ85DRAFT_15916 [Elsinoe ampelina]